MNYQKALRAFKYFLFFALLWWILSDGSSYQLWLAALIVSLTTYVAIQTPSTKRPLVRIRLRALAQLLPYFIIQSFKGGFAVALLAFQAKQRLDPQLVEYQVRIPKNSILARLFFASMIGLFPGSLSCGYSEDTLILHVLRLDLVNHQDIAKLEGLVIALLCTKAG